ncbi:MAG: hypothetical protein LBQ88_17225 [Treponema sp.]|jgi:hypothetical protein|nr:hypothetical protein [Treponema sp.]
MEKEHRTSGAQSGGAASYPEQELVYYYNREHRLARASPAVQALNEQKASSRNTVFKSPMAVRPLVILFSTIVILTVTGFIMGAFSGKDEGKKLGGNSITAEAMRYKGATYIALKKTYAGNEHVYTGTVDIAVSVPELKSAEAVPIITERVFFSLEQNEEYRFSVPYEAPELLILLKSETEMISLVVWAD